tara:strand:- start:627 stop:947 length:321 start_codon:yes stop_codon:yes gene_type:complete
MIIKKDFDDFKKILENKEKSKTLLHARNWFYKLLFFQNPFKEIIVKNDMVVISIISGKYIYNAEFVRELTKNQIEIKNSKFGAVAWYFLNSYISKRIEYNWEEAIK